MSRGKFNYIQDRHEFQEAIKTIKLEIETGGYSTRTIIELEKGLKLIEETLVYMDKMDGLFSGDFGELTFYRKLQENLTKIEK